MQHIIMIHKNFTTYNIQCTKGNIFSYVCDCVSISSFVELWHENVGLFVEDFYKIIQYLKMECWRQELPPHPPLHPCAENSSPWRLFTGWREVKGITHGFLYIYIELGIPMSNPFNVTTLDTHQNRYCKIIFIRWKLNFVWFMVRPIHEFKFLSKYLVFSQFSNILYILKSLS